MGCKSAYGIGESVAYKQVSLLGKWHDGEIIAIDSSKPLPFTVRDKDTGDVLALRETNIA